MMGISTRVHRGKPWAASEPMQPTPLLLSAEEGGRVSLTLEAPCWPLVAPPLKPAASTRRICEPRHGSRRRWL